MRRAAPAAALGLSILALGPGARAAGEGADALFDQGLKLFDAGRTHEACERFEASLKLDPAMGTLQNLATCHEQEGRTARAHAEFTELADRAAKAGVGQKARELLGRQRAAALVKKLSKVELRLGADANVAEIRVDDAPLDRALWSAPVALDPGPHTLLFSAPGKVAVTRPVNVSANPGVEPLDVPRLADVALPPPPPRPASPWRPVSLALGGAGVVSLVLTAVFGGLTFADKSAAEPHCMGKFCDAQGLSSDDAAHRYATASTATLVIGLAAVGSGAFLWFWTGQKLRTGVGAMPAVGGAGGGFRVDGVW